jgi:hypothetical protein
VIRESETEVPAALRYQIYRLFGNVEEILEFSRDVFFPKLVACKGKVQAIADLINSFIQDDFFYCYIVYNVNYANVQPLIISHIDFFRKRFDGCLGIESFLIQPVQRLPRIQMILCALITEITKDIDKSDKAEIAACCVAEKNMQRFLNRCNDAMALHDIIETQQIEASLEILASIQKEYGVDDNKPSLLLVPKQCPCSFMREPVSFSG